jgi:hypothetical protein
LSDIQKYQKYRFLNHDIVHRFCGVVGSNFGEPKVIRSHGLKLLASLLEVDTANPSILEMDAFGLLVALTFSLPSLFNGDQAAPLPSGNIQVSILDSFLQLF